MNWIRKKVIAWVREDWDEAHRFNGRQRPEVVLEDTTIMDDPIRFELQSVIGGHILKVRQPYDSKTDRQDSATYIIQTGEDIGARISKIVNLELLK
jgi:hypothetical protein